ncbi:unnamed protein product [Boreogadus saida]
MLYSGADSCLADLTGPGGVRIPDARSGQALRGCWGGSVEKSANHRPSASSEHSVAAKSGGCFPGDALVTTETGGRTAIRDLQPGDRVLTATFDPAHLVYSEVLTFLDRDPATRKLFHTVRTHSGGALSLTAAHLLFVARGNCTEGAEPTPGDAMMAVYASDARPGQCVLVVAPGNSDGGDQGGRLSRVVGVSGARGGGRKGAYAPLTAHGTLVVDGMLASCYAAVDGHELAHAAFAPLRLLGRWWGGGREGGEGLHWYGRVLHWVGRKLLDPGRFHPLGVAEDGW